MNKNHNIQDLLIAMTLRSLMLFIACSFLIHTAHANKGRGLHKQTELPKKELTYGAFCGAKNQTKYINLTSIRNMDTHQLFASADYLRNRKMSAEQRVFNYYWLHQSSSNTLTGSKALSHFLRLGFTTYWSQNSELWNGEEEPLLIFESRTMVTLWGEYKLKASRKRIALKYQMTF